MNTVFHNAEVASDSDNDSLRSLERGTAALPSSMASPDSPPPSPAHTRIEGNSRQPAGPSVVQTSSNRPFELTILGSGNSAAVPQIACVTDPVGGCECCLKSVHEEGKKNRRGNTGAILRIPGPTHEEDKTILIDCGKTFRQAAIDIFPRKGLRRIDALILTHHHADAIDGLDDLRAWTYESAIEKTIPVYCTRTTFSYINSGFPYMIKKAAVSGGGAVPSFDWHIINDLEPFDIQGVRIQPLPVHHGQYFTTPPSPLICLGFLIESSILYMSDVSSIPAGTWDILKSSIRVRGTTSSPLPRLKALIIDCNGLRHGGSHIGFPQTVDLAYRLNPCRSYLTDLGHKISHECWLHTCLGFGQSKRPVERVTPSRQFPREHPDEREQQPPYEHVYEGFDPHVEDYELFGQRAKEAVVDWMGGTPPPFWIRPLCDGMTIAWEDGDGRGNGRRVWDDEHHD